MKLLLDYGRELGLPLRGLHMGVHYSWTTDPAKAEAMREAGARLEHYSHQGWAGGWQVSFPVGSEVLSA